MFYEFKFLREDGSSLLVKFIGISNEERNITYRELRDFLNTWSDEELDTDVTIYLTDIDEYFGIKSLVQDPTGGVLDDNHWYFKL